MSNKTHERATRIAISLVKDAYGNGLTGNDIRSMQFLALAIQTLEAQADALASKNDVRALNHLERVINEGFQSAEKFTPFSDVRLQDSVARFAEHGIDFEPLGGQVSEELAVAEDSSSA